VHEGAEVEAELSPQCLTVRLENGPLATAVQTLLDEQSHATDDSPVQSGRQPSRLIIPAHPPNESPARRDPVSVG
jgi:hypothetical protein